MTRKQKAIMQIPAFDTLKNWTDQYDTNHLTTQFLVLFCKTVCTLICMWYHHELWDVNHVCTLRHTSSTKQNKNDYDPKHKPCYFHLQTYVHLIPPHTAKLRCSAAVSLKKAKIEIVRFIEMVHSKYVNRNKLQYTSPSFKWFIYGSQFLSRRHLSMKIAQKMKR